MFKIKVVVTVCLLFSCIHAKAQQVENIEEKISLIRAELEAIVSKEDIPAVSMVVVFEDEHYCLNYGSIYRGSTESVREQSIYQIASLGKMFVGIVAQSLILENVISPDEAITDYLELNLKESKIRRLNKITIRHLLHHTSGLPGDAKAAYKRKDGEAYQYDFKNGDFEIELKKARIKSINTYRYSNLGYALLAHILEKASGQSFEELLNRYIIEAYDLNSTFLQLPKEKEIKVATPYRKDNRQIKTSVWSMGKFAPPSAIYISTDDLRKLLKVQLDMYRLYGPEERAQPLILSYDLHTKSEKYNVKYGYGINQWTPSIYGHTGDMDGFASDYSFNIDKNYGIVLLTSSGEDWINPLIIKANRILSK